MSKHAYVQTRYLVQLVLVFIWTISLLVSDPLNYRGKQMQRQGLVPTTLWLTRLKDPLKQKIAWHDPKNTDASMPRFTVIEVDKQPAFDSVVYNFLTEHTFTEDEDFSTFGDISKNYMSPHTRAMVIMGCYGDPLHSAEMKHPEVTKMAHNASTAFMLNIMLQTWEDGHNKFDRKQAAVSDLAQNSNDRSACSCMKDFASPALLKTREGRGDTRYEYDSCLLQNLVDYPATNNTRQRVDPMKFELQEYTKLLMAYYTTQNNTANWANINIVDASKNHPEIHQLISIIGTTSVSNLKGLMDHLNARIDVMYPHNKLRTPKAHNNAEDTIEGLSSYPPSVSKDSFALYMKKYRSAFQVCAHNGVPQYQTKQLVQLAATKFSKLGTSFLLGAAMIGFSVLYIKLQCDNEQDDKNSETPKTEERRIKDQTVSYLVAFFEFTTRVMIIVSLVITLLSISHDLGDENASEKMTILTFTTAVWWVFASVLLVNFGIETWQMTKPTREEKTYVRSQISQDVCVIGGLANFGVSMLLHRGESDEYVVTACFVLFLTIGLIQHCSNLVRMMQLYTAHMLKPTTGNAHAQIGIAYNRVLVIVLVAVGLLGYVMLASSSIQTWTVDVLYGYQRVRIFAICAFLIFSTFDIFFEVLVVLKYGQVALFNDQHPRKMMWTGWVIVVSLFILHMHQYSALCMSRDPNAPEDVCNIFHYFFRGESIATPHVYSEPLIGS
jgi:uncharacterized membrane protein